LREIPSTLLKPSKKKNKRIQTGISVTLFEDANSLLHSFKTWNFVHVHREANFFVHNLASWTCACNFDGLIYISFISNWLFVREDGIGH
jgi:hypothetical protein